MRYADDFRIFCRTKTVAERTKIAITQWLKERLKLEVSQDKTRVVNVKRRYSEFLGFKMKVHSKGNKKVVRSHISDKQLTAKRRVLVEQVKRIRNPRPEKGQLGEIFLFNKMVMGIQNYYQIATNISKDARKLNRAVMTVVTNRLKGISRKGRKLTPSNQTHVEVINEIKLKLFCQPLFGRSLEYANNRISLYFAQKGLCAVTGEKFTSTYEIHCHHKLPRLQGGTDKYNNLILVTGTVHKLIHATNAETIQKYLQACKPNLKKLNVLRKLVGNFILSAD